MTYHLAELGPSKAQVEHSLAEWHKHIGEVDPNPDGLLGSYGSHKLANVPYVEFGCYAQLDSTVDIYVTGIRFLNENECEIDGRWGDLRGKPRVSIRYNFLTKIGTMERVNYPN